MSDRERVHLIEVEVLAAGKRKVALTMSIVNLRALLRLANRSVEYQQMINKLRAENVRMKMELKESVDYEKARAIG